MNRLEWRVLAERWLVDAQVLLENHCWSAAYYVAGYAVECGLKACVLARVEATPEVILEDRKFSEKCWTHNVEELVKQAGLETTRVADMAANPILDKNWLVVAQWNERARYATWSQARAEQLNAAITDHANGVMQWMRVHW